MKGLVRSQAERRKSKVALLVFSVVLVLVVLVGAAVAIAQGTWTTKASIPTAREGYGAAEVGGVFYYIAGYHWGDTVINEAYDSATDTWTAKAPLPDNPRAETVAVSDGSYVYLIGGRPVGLVGNDLWRYDPATDTWRSLSPMPTARATEHMAVYYQGHIYVVGGRMSDAPGGWGALSTLEIYDIATDTWTVGAPMPEPRSDAVAIEYGGKIYVFGGFDETGAIRDTTFIYDISSDTWTVGAPMPEPRANPVGGKCADGIHVIGGLDSSWLVTSTNYVYNPVANAWGASTPIPNATVEVQGISYGGKIYVVGGGIFGAGSENNLNQVFECGPISVTIDIKPGSFPNSINLKSKGNVPVAILSSSTFDATTVDQSTVIFAGASPLPIGKSPEDVNDDGLLDIVLHFRTQDLNLQPSDTEAYLSGNTFTGQEFGGSDSVRIVK
jgi:N-acetylneuraminic acid mutarotase